MLRQKQNREITSFNSLEQLECRKMLAAAASAVNIPGVTTNQVDDTVGLMVDFEPRSTVFQQPSSVGGLVTGRQTGDRGALALQFLLDHADEMGLTAADIDAAQLTNRATDPTSGITYVNFQQTLHGLKIDNTNGEVNFTKFGEVITAGSNFVPGIEAARQSVSAPVLSSMIHPSLALRTAADKLDLQYPASLESLRFLGGNDLKFIAKSGALSDGEIPINAQYLATERGIRLAWQFNLQIPGSADWFNVSVDAQTGTLLRSVNMTSYFAGHEEWAQAMANRGTNTAVAANGQGPTQVLGETLGAADESYNVYPIPLESPYDGPRQIVVNPHTAGGTNATDPSPYGWLDTNGVVGAESNLSLGNNVEAHDDREVANTATDADRADGGPTLTFDFPLDLAQEPTVLNNQKAAITNLFYWNNVLHDVHYKYGFTEQFFNFQMNNYGRGGLGSDPVQADAQDSSGTNNANFATPADGSDGRMQMYLWNAPTPDRDGDIDAGIIAHEYGHGVSNRLVMNGTGQMSSNQSRGMGEGWSDFYALMFQQTASDTINGRHPIGTYALNQNPDTGAGIRVHPYSYNTTTNPITWAYYGTGVYNTNPYVPGGGSQTRSTAVHFGGTIWNSTLWDMNWLLINKHGYDQNLYTGYNAAGTTAERAGNKLAMKLVMDAMKLLVPTNPSFTESRDSIIAADQALTGGANFREIWTAFARRGLGVNVAPQTAASTATITANYETPIFTNDPYVTAATPNGAQANTPISSVTFTFGEAMNTGSFAVADDVLSFTGPGGVNLAPSITGFTWVNANTLKLDVAVQRTNGAYQLVLAPTILSADNGNQLDQDFDQIPGEPIEDRFTLNVTKTGSAGPLVTTQAPTNAPSFSPLSQADFTFNEAMDPSTFSIAGDILSFTGPGGVNLKPQISGFSFLNGNTTLRVNMTTQTVAGTYTMLFGPQIGAALDGVVMDQDADGTTGEPAQDAYTATFNITRTVGPDTFGYLAAEYPLQATQLTAGQAGVVAIATSQDDSPGVNIPLAANVFRYYTTNYTGATSLFVTPNGNISFTTANTSAANGDLSSTPAAAVIAPLWDDWVTNVNTDDQVLYKFVDADGNGSAEQLVIQWDAHRFQATGNPVKFQLLLELNTGADAGRMIFNYFDLDAGAGNVATNGASSSVGIKDTGVQSNTLPSRRILISRDSSSFPWVQTGKAIVLDSDVTPPTVNASTYAFETGQSASFVFSEGVVNFDATRVGVQNLTTASPVVPTAVSYDPGTFTGGVTLANDIADGNYQVTIAGNIDGAGVRDAAGNPLDGDNSGVAGGNNVFNFFFLRGDANRDRSVDIADFAILTANFNQPGVFSTGDFNYSAMTDIADFALLASKFNTSLPPAIDLSRSAAAPGGQTVALSPASSRSPFNSTTPVWSSIEQNQDVLPA